MQGNYVPRLPYLLVGTLAWFVAVIVLWAKYGPFWPIFVMVILLVIFLLPILFLTFRAVPIETGFHVYIIARDGLYIVEVAKDDTVRTAQGKLGLSKGKYVRLDWEIVSGVKIGDYGGDWLNWKVGIRKVQLKLAACCAHKDVFVSNPEQCFHAIAGCIAAKRGLHPTQMADNVELEAAQATPGHSENIWLWLCLATLATLKVTLRFKGFLRGFQP